MNKRRNIVNCFYAYMAILLAYDLYTVHMCLSVVMVKRNLLQQHMLTRKLLVFYIVYLVIRTILHHVPFLLIVFCNGNTKKRKWENNVYITSTRAGIMAITTI
jgi:hypothetical protein